MAFVSPCRRLVKYDGATLDISGLAGPEELKFSIGQLRVKRELLQAATEIVLVYDAIQYANCVRIHQMPRDSPERIKLIYKAMEAEREILVFMLLTRLIAVVPDNDRLQKALIEWIASHATAAQELASHAQETQLKLGLPRSGTDAEMPSSATLRSTIQVAEKAEPQLPEVMRLATGFDMGALLESLGSKASA
jgi:hypothetical protein